MRHALALSAVALMAFSMITGCSAPAPPPKESSAAPSTASPSASKEKGTGDGTYLVGEDIPPGTYTTEGPGSDDVLDACYWERSKDDSGTLEAILANETVTGPSRLTVAKGEVLKLSGGCAWKQK